MGLFDGLFGAKKGSVSLREENEIETIINENGCSVLETRKELKIYAPSKAKITYSNALVTIKTKKYTYEFPNNDLSRIVVIDDNSEAYYSVLATEEESDEILQKDFEEFRSQHNLWPMINTGTLAFYAYPNGNLNIGNINGSNANMSVNINGVQFDNIDTSRVVGFFVNNSEGRIYKIVKVLESPQRNAGATPLDDNDEKNRKNDEDLFNKSEDFDLKNVINIIVEADNADIEIVQSNLLDEGIGNVTSEGSFTGYSSYEYKAYVDGDTLYVKEKVEGNNISGNVKITIAAMNYIMETVKVTTTNGSIGYFVNGSGFNNGIFTSTNGDVNINFTTTGIEGLEVPFNSFAIKTTNGSIDYHVSLQDTENNYITYENIILASTNGDINGESVIAHVFNATSTNGDITVQGYFNNVTAKSTNGDIDVHQIFFNNGSANLSSGNGDITYTPEGLSNLNLNITGELISNAYTKVEDGHSADVSISTRGDITIQES